MLYFLVLWLESSLFFFFFFFFLILLPVLDLIVCLFSYQMNATGCASLTVDNSVFFNTKFEAQIQDTFLVNVTEEGTGELLANLNYILFIIFTRPPL